MRRHFLVPLLAVLLVPVGLRIWSWPAVQETKLDPVDVAAGKELFTHVWTVNDPLAGGDGVGPVFNAASCVACHFQGGLGGAGSRKENVTTYQVQREVHEHNQRHQRVRVIAGVLHAQSTSPEFLETMRHLDPTLPAISTPTLEMLNHGDNRMAGAGMSIFSQRNTPALFGAKLIDEIPDREIIAIARKQLLAATLTNADQERAAVGRVLFSKDGKVGKFGWKAQTVSLLDFVQGACANELGLSNPNQPQPVSIAKSDYVAPGDDLTLKQCQQMASFIAALPNPRQELPQQPEERANVHHGRKVFASVGCAECHVPNVGSVQGIYSDLLLHRMGKELEGRGHYDAPSDDGDPTIVAQPDEWRTPPLWGIADSAPYLHDGRAKTLEEAIQLHAGQGLESARRFARSTHEEQTQLIAFLKSLRAPN